MNISPLRGAPKYNSRTDLGRCIRIPCRTGVPSDMPQVLSLVADTENTRRIFSLTHSLDVANVGMNSGSFYVCGACAYPLRSVIQFLMLGIREYRRRCVVLAMFCHCERVYVSASAKRCFYGTRRTQAMVVKSKPRLPETGAPAKLTELRLESFRPLCVCSFLLPLALSIYFRIFLAFGNTSLCVILLLDVLKTLELELSSFTHNFRVHG